MKIDSVLEDAREVILDYMYTFHHNWSVWACGLFIITTPNDFGDRMIMATPFDLSTGNAYKRVIAYNGEYCKELTDEETIEWIHDLKAYGYELEMIDLDYPKLKELGITAY